VGVRGFGAVALPAGAEEGCVARVQLEAEVRHQPSPSVVEDLRGDVEDAPAAVALHVGVSVRLLAVLVVLRGRRLGEVVDGGRAPEVDVRQHPGVHERGEGPVDGGPVHRRLQIRDTGSDLLGAQVLVGPVGGVDDPQDGIPGRRDPLARGAEAGDGTGHARALGSG
jgi:hypothetical protein